MTQATNFHNTTNLKGEELQQKDMTAKSQEARIHDIMIDLQNAVEWWTRDALNREYARRYWKRLKDQSISRALSNLSSWWCPDCKKYSSSPECKCGDKLVITGQLPRLEKSVTAMWKSDEGDRVHAWRLFPNPGQGDLFGSSVVDKTQLGGMQ
jgi:hypothetical protein